MNPERPRSWTGLVQQPVQIVASLRSHDLTLFVRPHRYFLSCTCGEGGGLAIRRKFSMCLDTRRCENVRSYRRPSISTTNLKLLHFRKKSYSVRCSPTLILHSGIVIWNRAPGGIPVVADGNTGAPP